MMDLKSLIIIAWIVIMGEWFSHVIIDPRSSPLVLELQREDIINQDNWWYARKILCYAPCVNDLYLLKECAWAICCSKICQGDDRLVLA